MKSNLLIFRDEASVSGLLGRLRNNETLAEYFSTEPDLDGGLLTKSTLLREEAPSLDASTSKDADSAIKVYEYLGDIGRTFGTDPRLWCYLTHFTFREYVQGRWKLPALGTKDEELNKLRDMIVERWFFNRSKAISHNAIARLWWAAELTYKPWDNLDNGGVKHDDPYIYTKILFSNQNVQVSLLEREIFSSPTLLIATLEFIRLNPDYASVKIQALSKELNLIAGVKKLSTLEFGEALEVVTQAAASLRE